MNEIIAFVAAYIIGSIPFGFLVGKLCGVDIRRIGSGNIGATNVLRTLGRRWGYTVFALDLMKGILAGMLGWHLGGSEVAAVVCGVLAIVGHNYPLWLGFKGGKGIATSAGVIIAIFPYATFLSATAVWILLFFATGYVSLASIGGSIVLPTAMLVLLLMGKTTLLLFIVSLLLSVLAIWRHQANIQRLIAGTEPKFRRNRKG